MPIPTRIKLHRASRELELEYPGVPAARLSAEFLRVHSPSAEVQGHGMPRLQTGKQDVGLLRVEPAGNYALKLIFDDGHDSGLYSWDYLYELIQQREHLWQAYLDALHQAGASRDPYEQPVRLLMSGYHGEGRTKPMGTDAAACAFPQTQVTKKG